ncbi:MAG TPA: type II toxin-antitoxin system HicA family toxin [Candidatus Saccharimonadales bacterium]|nr:type II toxin-antitoxin system HicA family toxin [Candidatus Saccharimonadales bacterium]
MPKLSPISARDLIRLLEKLGFVQIRQKGSHVRLEHKNGRKTSIPLHAGEKVGVGLLRKILRDTDVSRKEFERLRK